MAGLLSAREAASGGATVAAPPGASPGESADAPRTTPRGVRGIAPDVAVVLAGGKSRRLGQDKALLMVEGKPMLQRIVELAGRFCPVVAVSGRDPSALLPGVPWFLDEIAGAGPLGGIVTALEHFRTSCLILSCDLPRLDDPTLKCLIRAWRERPQGAVLTTYLQEETGFIEALVSIYEPEAATLLRAACEAGCRKLSQAIPAALRHEIPYSVRNCRPFFNLNTPSDLAGLGRI